MENAVNELLNELDELNLWEKRIRLKRYQLLSRSGEVDRRLFLVKEGSFRIFLSNDREEHTIRLAYQGSFFAALDSFLNGKATVYNIQALKASEVQLISREKLMRFLAEEPSRQQGWRSVLEQIIAQQLEREKDLLSSSPIDRFQSVLKRSPRVFQEVPHKYIASYLRMTPETLSRLKNLDSNQDVGSA